MADLNQAITDSLSAPKSVNVDGQQVTEHDLQSQIAATRFQMATRARTLNRMAGVSLTKLKPHGSVLSDDCG